MEKQILYHGSNVIVEHPLVSIGRKDLDFGPGFYLTPLFEQASKWAVRIKTIRRAEQAIVNTFEFTLPQDCKVKRFIFASSSSVYVNNTELPKKEEYIGKPLSPYALTKCVNELYAGVFAKTYGIEIYRIAVFQCIWQETGSGWCLCCGYSKVSENADEQRNSYDQW